MQPIILLGIVAVGAAALSTGFLAPEIEFIWVQNLGVGDADLASPVNHVAVDLDVQATPFDPTPLLPDSGDEYFKNAVNECSWHIGTDDLINGETDIEEVICKITNIADNAIAECGMEYPPTFDVTDPQNPIENIDYPFSAHETCVPDEAFPGALELDNVHDVRIVVRGDDPAANPVIP